MKHSEKGMTKMKMYEKPHRLTEYIGHEFSCDCGRKHSADIRQVCVGQGMLREVPGLIKKYGYKKVFVVCDANTNAAAGCELMKLLRAEGVDATAVILKHIGFDEATVGEIFISKPTDCDLLVAVGSGTINDMTRFISFRFGLPYFIIATAASMDGFASTGASLNVNNLKTSFETQTPQVIVGDVDVLRQAPYKLIAAGLGDLLGKYTCIADWKLSHLINGETYCEKIVALVEKCVQDVMAVSHQAKDRNPVVQGKIMEGLVLTGVAMSFHGNSRPASGCEHHMSHYWEVIFEQRGEKPANHGTQVSVATVLILKLIDRFLKTKIDFERAKRSASAYNEADWISEIKRAYGSAAEGVIAIEKEAQKNEVTGRLLRIEAIEKDIETIREILEQLPSADEIADILKSLDAPVEPCQIGVNRALLKDTFMYCKEVRVRYTFLQMLWDLDVLDELSDQVIDEVYI